MRLLVSSADLRVHGPLCVVCFKRGSPVVALTSQEHRSRKTTRVPVRQVTQHTSVVLSRYIIVTLNDGRPASSRVSGYVAPILSIYSVIHGIIHACIASIEDVLDGLSDVYLYIYIYIIVLQMGCSGYPCASSCQYVRVSRGHVE